MTFDQLRVRQHFPFFDANPELIYLDNAATSLKPRLVTDAMTDHLSHQSANTGRSSHRLAGRVSREIESARAKIAGFINSDPDGLAFTSGATHSLNVVAQQWGRGNLTVGDEVLVCSADHSAAVEPWRSLAREVGIQLVEYGLTASGDADLSDVLGKVTYRTRAIAITHVHNVFGERTSIADFRRMLPQEVIVSVDAAQSVGHTEVDVQALGADFLSFSAHKMFGPPGVGALWASQRVRQQVDQFAVGGAATGVPDFASRLEVGTMNTAGIIGFSSAVDFFDSIDRPRSEAHVASLTHRAIDGLARLRRVRLLPGVASSSCPNLGYGIVSFRIDDVDAADVGFVLDNAGICVRTGAHCTAGSSTTGNSVRIAAHLYNTIDEIDRALAVVAEIAS